jgi:hypothetical protein
LQHISSAGEKDIYLVKYDADGNHLWGFALNNTGDSSNSLKETSVSLDAAGRVYLMGHFNGTNLPLTSEDDIFVESLDGDLNFRWGFALASDGALDGGHRVAFDSRTNLYVTGWFAGTTDFDGSSNTFNLASMNTNGAIDWFLAKYDRNGSFLWARGFGGVTTNAADLSIPAGLTVDFSDAAYLTGQYYGTNVTFHPLSASGALPDSLGQNDGFIVKFNSDGQLAGYELRVTSITQSNNTVVITWPGSPTVKLQRTISLQIGSWLDVAGSLGMSSVTEASTNTAAFYRLTGQ